MGVKNKIKLCARGRGGGAGGSIGGPPYTKLGVQIFIVIFFYSYLEVGAHRAPYLLVVLYYTLAYCTVLQCTVLYFI